MRRSIIIGSLMTSIGFASSAVVAEPAPAVPMSAKPAEVCLKDLQAFNAQMEKDGYGFGRSEFSDGYPMLGYGHPLGGYQHARPGYEIRTLTSAANILARNGQQQSCEDVLTTSRNIYKDYTTALTAEKAPEMDRTERRAQAIAKAVPVEGNAKSFRSDQLVGMDIRDLKNESLGSVDDIILSPKTGDIAYLVIGRGGIFGLDESYVPVPWKDFKITPSGTLLVLDTTLISLDTAPHVKHDHFASAGDFDLQSQKIDTYWK